MTELHKLTNEKGTNGEKILSRLYNAIYSKEGDVFAHYLFLDKSMKSGNKTLYQILLEAAESSNLSLGMGIHIIVVPTNNSMKLLANEYFQDEYEKDPNFSKLVLGHVISQDMTELFPKREIYYGANGYKYIGEPRKNGERLPGIGDSIETIEIIDFIDVNVEDLAVSHTMQGVTTKRKKIRIVFIEGFLVPQKFTDKELKGIFK